MPTSVRGNSERGFTLVEVMVVLVIVAIAASMVSLSIGKGADPLRDDAQRLLDAFTVAEGEARSDGRALRWSPASGGWSFERAGRSDAPTAQDDRPLPMDRLEHDAALRPRSWRAGQVQWRLEPDRPLVFNTEWVADPFSLRLRAGDSHVTLTRDAAGHYDIR